MVTKFSQGNIRAGKLTPTQVYELREAYAQGATQGQLSRRYGISIGQVGRIVRGEVWQQYTNPAAEPLSPLAFIPPNPDIDAEAAKLLRKLQGDPVTISDSKADLEQDIPADRQAELLSHLQRGVKAERKPLDDLEKFTEENPK